jgi:hypothetical protein
MLKPKNEANFEYFCFCAFFRIFYSRAFLKAGINDLSIHGLRLPNGIDSAKRYRFLCWNFRTIDGTREVTERCRLSFLTNSALVYEPKCGGGVAGSQPMNRAVHRRPNKLWRSNSIFNLCMGKESSRNRDVIPARHAS